MRTEVSEGRDPLPRVKPPFPTTAGLYGQPTVVNNIDTFAYVPSIVRRGAEWFRGHGTAGNPGTVRSTPHADGPPPGPAERPLRPTQPAPAQAPSRHPLSEAEALAPWLSLPRLAQLAPSPSAASHGPWRPQRPLAPPALLPQALQLWLASSTC